MGCLITWYIKSTSYGTGIVFARLCCSTQSAAMGLGPIGVVVCGQFSSKGKVWVTLDIFALGPSGISCGGLLCPGVGMLSSGSGSLVGWMSISSMTSYSCPGVGAGATRCSRNFLAIGCE